MKRIIMLAAPVLVAVATSSMLTAQSLVLVDSFYAPSLSKIQRYTLLLPSSFDSTRRYPILYLLHGLGGDQMNWVSKTRVLELVKDVPLVVVMPAVENSWCVNSATDSTLRYEDYLVNDLRYRVQQRLAIDSSRQAIAGLSMGGYGAVLLALRHPSIYRFAGSLSGALSIPLEQSDSLRMPERMLLPSLRRAFGDKAGALRKLYNVLFLYKQTTRDSLPYLYMSIGNQDAFGSFIASNRLFCDLLRTHHASYEYHEVPGRHDWVFWGREIRPLLNRLREVLNF